MSPRSGSFLIGALASALFAAPVLAQCPSPTVQVASGGSGDVLVATGPCSWGRIVTIPAGSVLVSGTPPTWSAAPPTTTAACVSGATQDSYITEIGANNPGAYTNGTNCAGGVLRFDWNATRFNTTLVSQGPNGSATTPTYSFSSDTASGLYYSGGYLAFRGSGSTMLLGNPFIRINGITPVGFTNGDPVSNALDSGFSRLAARSVALGNGTAGDTSGNLSLQTMTYTNFVFANIGTTLTANGMMGYCSDCTITATCAGSGTGAIAKRLNGVNVCN